MSGDTIFALSSGGGRAAIAVIRVSGPAARDALLRIGGQPLPRPREAALRRFRAPDTGEPIDRGLALWFPGPASATGEDVAEFHVHGGPAVLDSLLGAFAALPGLRPAEPGAFTRRAFEAGRLDLTEAEGIADLVAAETEAQRRQALSQMEGGLHRLYDGWRARLMETMAHAEAAIDFSDQDLGSDPLAAAGTRLAALEAEIAAHLDDARRGERLRSGFTIAIVGAPNAGKSSLLNRLAGREAAIVSARAGTTRDVVEVRLDLAGWPLTLADTAGLRESRDEIESEGVRRALDRAASADLTLVVFDGALWPEVDAPSAALLGEAALPVLNKTDLLAHPATARRHRRHQGLRGLLPQRRRHRGAAGDAGGRDRAALPGRRRPCPHPRPPPAGRRRMPGGARPRHRRAGRRAPGRGAASRGARARPHHRARGRGGRARPRLPRFLHRQMSAAPGA